MVKDVVKSECRMIVMWSSFRAVEALENRSDDREEIHREQGKMHQPPHVVNHLKIDDNYVVRQSRELIPLLQVLYCNL